MEKNISQSQPPKPYIAMDGYRVIYNGYTASAGVKPPVPSGGSSAIRPAPSTVSVTQNGSTKPQ